MLYSAAAVVFAGMFLFVFLLNVSPARYDGVGYMPQFHHYNEADQYARLAESLLQGQVTLDLPVSDELASLDDPYNAQDRIAAGSEDVPIYWDHAYYRGKYYCYFGVVPAVLFYAPYQLVTGTWLPTPWAIGFIGVLTVVALAALVRRIGLRYFGETSTTLSHIACLAIAFSGYNFAYLAFVARFYSVPIMTSLLFTSLGLWFWMGSSGGRPRALPAAKHGKIAEGERGTISAWRLTLGSLCMALNLGCRPQFMLACFFAFVIFKDEIFVTRELFSVRGAKATVAALLPFVIVIPMLLAYNYVRFGSLLDFGSAYNLTGFNMTDYFQSRMLTIILMVTYLFQPLNFTPSFPFLSVTNTEHLQYGWAPNEPFFGGFFLLKSALILALFFPAVWRTLKERKLAGFVVLCALFTVIVLLVDTRTAGITQRYFSDFGLYVSLAACIVLFSLQRQCGPASKGWRAIKVVVVAAIVATYVIGTLTLFSPNRYDAIVGSGSPFDEAVTSLLETGE